MTLKRIIFDQVLINLFIFVPLLIGAGAGYLQQEKERRMAGEEVKPFWWVTVCSWGVIFYCVGFTFFLG